MRKLLAALLILLFSSLYLPQTAFASGNGPSYLIQPGDNMSLIASRFGLTLDELTAANPEIDPNAIAVGDKVNIPGLEGITGLLITDPVQFGDSLNSLSRRNQIDQQFLIKLNHITNPSELYAGLGLILPQAENFKPLTNRVVVQKNMSLLEAAARNGDSPYDLLLLNQATTATLALPSDILYDRKDNPDNAQSALPSTIERMIITPLPMTQGGTVKVLIKAKDGIVLSGQLVDKPFHFFSIGDGEYIALQGVHAMLEPGPFPLRIEATNAEGSSESFEQNVIVQSGNYPEDPILNVDPATIDPAVSDPEFTQISEITSKISDTQYWNGIFLSPASFNNCFTSKYGNRRTYVGIGTDMTLNSFHSGLDFCGGTGLPITAPANGKVVFSGPLTVRGNATIIDHGLGIFSGIWHQDSSLVTVGQDVKQGDVIGYVGGTGRVTGAHLHWEVWVNGVQVNPMEWLEIEYP